MSTEQKCDRERGLCASSLAFAIDYSLFIRFTPANPIKKVSNFLRLVLLHMLAQLLFSFSPVHLRVLDHSSF